MQPRWDRRESERYQTREPIPLHWEYALTGRDALPDQSPTNAKFHLAIETWKRLPLAVANRLGPLVIGNIP